MSRFSAFVRTSKGKGVMLIVLAALAYAGLETLYMNTPPESKPQGAEKSVPKGPGRENFVTHEVPKPMPAMALQKADGAPTGLSAHEEDFLVVNFWATWCAPCRKEMPQLDALAKRYQGRGVKVIALSVDRGGAAKPEKFLNELGVAHLTRLYDPSYKAARAAKLIGLPTTLLVSPKGQEIGRLAGEADWDAPEVHALLDYYLARD